MAKLPQSSRNVVIVIAIALVALAASGGGALALTGAASSGQGAPFMPGPLPTMTASPPIIASPVPAPTGPGEPVTSGPGAPGSVPGSPGSGPVSPPPPISPWPKAPTVPNPGGYDLCGVIASVVPGTADRGGAVLVCGTTGATCDRGLAAIAASTRWFRMSAGGALQPIDAPTVDKALVGMQVGVTYDGAVAESYPVQGTAAVVVLLP